MRKYIVVLSTLLFVLMGCSKLIDVKLDTEVTVFFSSDSDKRVKLTAKDSEYIMLKEWLELHKADWLSTSGKYAGGVYLTSGIYGIQVNDSKVVLYTNITDQPAAIYAQEIERSDLKALKNLAK